MFEVRRDPITGDLLHLVDGRLVTAEEWHRAHVAWRSSVPKK